MPSRLFTQARRLVLAAFSALPAMSCASEDDQVANTRAATLSDCGLETVILHLSGELSVIGIRGRPATLGSVAEQVVRTAGRQVLVIPA